MAKGKVPPKLQKWQSHLMKTFKQLKREDPTATFKEAMIVARDTFKR